MKDKYKNIDEIKLLKKSKFYMEALSQGINPFTGEYFDDSLLQNIKLQSCFDYISDVLADIIEMGGINSVKRKKIGRFIITKEQSDKIAYSKEPIGINALAERINDVIDLNKSDKITGNKLANIMYELGYLSQVDGTKQKCINEKSAEVGIKDIDREDYSGRKYKQIVYSTEAQKFVVEKLLASDLNNQGNY